MRGLTEAEEREYLALLEAEYGGESLLDGYRLIWAVDPAATAKTSADYSVAVLLAVKGYGDDAVVYVLDVVRLSEAPGAFAGATKAADMLNKIDGVYAPEKVEHSGSVDVATLTPAQRRARMAELLAKVTSARADGG